MPEIPILQKSNYVSQTIRKIKGNMLVSLDKILIFLMLKPNNSTGQFQVFFFREQLFVLPDKKLKWAEQKEIFR